MISAVLLILLGDFTYIFVKLFFKIDKLLFNHPYQIYVFDAFITHLILFIISIIFIKISKVKLLDILKIDKKLLYLIPITISFGMAFSIMGSLMFKFFSQIITDIGVIERNKEVYSELTSFLNKSIYFAVLGIITPISEEIFMRAYAYKVLRNRFNIVISILLNTIIFILFHLIPSFIPVIIFANIVLCLSYEYTKNLYVPIILHLTINSYIFFV